MNKIVTLCGSMKFKDKMMEIAKKLEINDRYVVIQCVYSDAIFVINVNGYIGSSTSKEIQYAKKMGKEVMYLEPIK